jgi:hypothetical protein
MELTRWLTTAILLITVNASADTLAERALGPQLQQAVAKGDVALMKALRGTKLEARIAAKKAWRVTKEYSDFLVELELHDAVVEGLVRVPAKLGFIPSAQAVRAQGVLVDFEPFGKNGRIAWQPVIHADAIQRATPKPQPRTGR